MSAAYAMLRYALSSVIRAKEKCSERGQKGIAQNCLGNN